MNIIEVVGPVWTGFNSGGSREHGGGPSGPTASGKGVRVEAAVLQTVSEAGTSQRPWGTKLQHCAMR
jgi:hypothetical protein